MRPSIFCVASGFPEDVRQHVVALAEAGLLSRVICSLAFHGEGMVAQALRFVDKFAGTRWLHRCQRRVLYEVPERVMSCHPWSETWVHLIRWIRGPKLGPESDDWWGSALDRAASRQLHNGIRMVLGREDVSLRLFQAARACGIKCLYDLPIPHHAAKQEIMVGELSEFPEAASSYNDGTTDLPGRLRRKDRELELADHIIVASPFVRSTLRKIGVGDSRVSVIPYGCEPVSPTITTGPVRQPIVLCVGHLSLRKGTLRLLRVWKRLGAYRTHKLRLIGVRKLPVAALADFAGVYEHIPHLPHSELSRHYATAQVFVFPSAADGFGLVINESLSHGLPVIASSHTGARVSLRMVTRASFIRTATTTPLPAPSTAF